MEKHINIKNPEKENKSFVVSQGSYASPVKWKYINLEYLEKVAPNNYNFFSKMMEVFRSESIASMEKIKEHYSKNDFLSLQKTAHAMKPTGSYIGVDSLTMLVETLEQTASTENHGRIISLISEIESLVKVVNEEIEEFLKAA
jgi:HPt (histidine-containing phosphotransfer) domain-containing protein